MKCSIIVANYNNAGEITQALNSIEQQDYLDWEVVVVDDGSTDRSLRVIDEFFSTAIDKQKYIVVGLGKNQGVGCAKKTGVNRSSGEVIVICDADDALAPNALSQVVQAHTAHPDASIVFSSHYNCDHALHPIGIDPGSAPVVYSDILEDKISHLLSFKRKHYLLTAGFDSYFKLAVDKDIFYKLEEVGEVVFIDKPLYYYRISNKGISRGYERFNKSRDYKLTAIKNAIARREKSGVKQITQDAFTALLAEHYLLQAEGYILMNKPLGKPFLSSLLKSFYYRPGLNLKRKLKAVLLLSRVKRNLKSLLIHHNPQ
jgi:glycosyltransferase involved in cell wall biosynthesis